MLWDKLGQLLQGIPRRNLLVIGADMNSVVEPTPGLIDRGVLQQRERGADRELAGLLAVHQLVRLNTWRRARPHAAHTYSHGSIKTQIDFLFTRKAAEDAVALDLGLVPWRLGPKHRPVAGSLPWRAGWALHKSSKPPQLPYSLQALREAFRVNDPIIRQKLEPQIRSILVQPNPPPDLTSLNKQLQIACSDVFPASTRLAALRPRRQPLGICGDRIRLLGVGGEDSPLPMFGLPGADTLRFAGSTECYVRPVADRAECVCNITLIWRSKRPIGLTWVRCI